jgi:hypothetical protein
MSATERFRALHDDGLFVMPNAWDVGSARILEHLGCAALATTSSGHAASLGRLDQQRDHAPLPPTFPCEARIWRICTCSGSSIRNSGSRSR